VAPLGDPLMATVYTHAVVGLGLARCYTVRPMPWLYWGLAAAVAVIPDLDIFSPAPYSTPLGHRGITHSLLFAFALSMLAATAAYRRCDIPWRSLAALLFIIAATHGLLDAMTATGIGIPLFWPVGDCYGGRGPLLASDINPEWYYPWHSDALGVELYWVWIPLGLLMASMAALRHHRHCDS
jgi:inner membrane protein